MKKLILFFLLLPFFIQPSYSGGNPEFGKGTHVINIGAGIGSHRSIPLTASYEVCIIDNIAGKGSIGVGGLVGFRQHRYRTLGATTVYTSFIAGVRAAFHYSFVENLDTYAGFYTAYSYYTATQPSALSLFAPGAFVGARYYFNPGFAVMAEAGEGISNLNVGVAFRF